MKLKTLIISLYLSLFTIGEVFAARGDGGGDSGTTSVPEIDGGASLAAIGILFALVAITYEKYSKK